MAVGLILMSLIMTSIVGAYGSSSGTRAGVQSQASADAGIAAAYTGLFTAGNCAAQSTPGTYSSGSAPAYAALVQYDAGSGWIGGCPTATATRVKIVSTGLAQANGVNGASSGNSSKVEAVFAYLTPGVDASGVGMYLYGGGTVESNSTLDLSEASGAGLMIKNGSLDCSKNNTVINGSVLINGNLTFTGNCTVNGSAWVAGAATLGSGSVRDNLTAARVSPNPPGSHVGGTYTQSAVVPAVPGWAEIGYTPANWIDAAGIPYEVRTVTTAAACKLPDGSLGGTIAGKPVIINALGCPGGPTASNNTTVRLTSDVVIFAQSFDFSSVNQLKFDSSSSAAHRVWFVTPDYVGTDGLPTCRRSPAIENQGNFAVKNGFTIDDPISAMLYTPCAFDGNNGFEWRGQVYSGQYSSVKNNPVFTFVQVGIAGSDLDIGAATPPITRAQPGAVVSRRDLG
ncbi:hypothetical protein E3O42_16760 [Cryobacterium adonitolivorans]|uniref:Flp pilus-assembly TadG-like N-terminal domain-containing protein n=1 Tax=Cryobacterium adonitolivorans TaxID=1259189 RepID=A0A4V6QGN9_9MICO|nr:hypothetical protein [Cryobacterium adonitolivorans]TFB96789.1 hypothetical protein E3O42_16760 [Cryobacterium adonitolivorans]